MMKSINIVQRGSALLLCLILLIGLTFIALSAVQTGIMEVRMASAVEEEMNAFQTAQAAIDFGVSDPSYLPTTGPLNDTTTKPITLAPNTNIDDAFYTAADETVTVTVERTGDCKAPPRLRLAASLGAFSSFEYKFSSDIDKRKTRRGRSHQRQGYILLGPKC
jgi:Tfp pilus assembly protein PilX